MARPPAEDAPWNPRTRQHGSEEPRETWVSWRTLVIGAVVAVVLAFALIFGVRAVVDRGAPGASVASGDVPLIRAPEGPYKLRPADAGGAAMEGIDQSVFAAGEGDDPIGEIAVGNIPEDAARPEGPAPTDMLPSGAEEGEAALAEPSAVPAPSPGAATGVRREVESKAARVEPVDTASPAALQLGAFATAAAADAAWTRFTQRFAYLANLEKSVVALDRDGTRLHRLRAVGVASAAEARALCARLRAAGESCLVAG